MYRCCQYAKTLLKNILAIRAVHQVEEDDEED